MTTPEDVLDFWFGEATPVQWFAKDDGFDVALRSRFGALHDEAAAGGLGDWEATADGRMALILVLDQMSRNLYRGDAHAYATDPLARHYATRAVGLGLDKQVEATLRPFLYLPFEHSEDPIDQEHSMRLFGALDDPESARWARVHHDIIVRFGRFPHRNAALGRATTPTEQAFLDNGGFGG